MKNDSTLVANWSIDAARRDGQQITLSKLQKLVYFAYGWSLALYGKPIISEVVTMMPWGPGFQGIYDFAGEYGSEPVPSCLSLLDGCPTLREDDPRIPLLRRIWELYGRYSPSQLARMVNETGGPWDKTRRKYPDRTHVSIDDDLIMKAFKSKMQDSSTTVVSDPQNLDKTVEKLKVMNEKLSRNAETLAANNKSLSAMVDTLNSCHLISKGDLLDTQAAASYLGVTHLDTIRNWLEGGRFPGAFQSRGQWFFPAVELDKIKRRRDEILAFNADGEIPQPVDFGEDCDGCTL